MVVAFLVGNQVPTFWDMGKNVSKSENQTKCYETSEVSFSFNMRERWGIFWWDQFQCSKSRRKKPTSSTKTKALNINNINNSYSFCVSQNLCGFLHSTWFTWISSTRISFGGFPKVTGSEAPPAEWWPTAEEEVPNPLQIFPGKIFWTLVFPKIVVPQNGWSLWKTLLKCMIWGYRDTTIFGNIHILLMVQKSGDHLLRLLRLSHYLQGFIHPSRWLARFLPSVIRCKQKWVPV